MTFARKALPILAAVFVLLMPAVSFAAMPFSGEIIPTECHCEGSAPDFGCVLQTVQNLINFGVWLAILLATFAIVTAGIMWILNPINAQNKEIARTALLNAVIGIVIVLGAWLLVDFIMKALYNPDTQDATGKAWGPWNDIIQSNGSVSYCIVKRDPVKLPPLVKGTTPTSGVGVVTHPITNSGTGTVTNFADFFSFDPNVSKQIGAVSAPLSTMLTCMADTLSANGVKAKTVGRISALTDIYSGTDSTKIAQCNSVGSQGNSSCAHTRASCHYGAACSASAYAVDFGDQENTTALRDAARKCNPYAKWSPQEGDTHVHISVGTQYGCACDSGLPGI